MHLKSRVNLHPQTIKHMLLGHPWVTDDSFTKKFPINEKLLIGLNANKKEFAILLNDPEHKKVKARLWKIISPTEINQFSETFFWEDFKTRLHNACKKRHLLINNQTSLRENFYLIFGESDFLPGIFLQKLKNHYIIGLYTHFWDSYLEDKISPLILQTLKDFFPSEDIFLWVQLRNKKQEKKLTCLSHPELKDSDFVLQEYGLNYKIKINSYYDFGIYTDMSAIRPLVLKKFKEINSAEKPKLLNLFSYTSAYSLYFLNNGFQEAVSVDLSKKYLDWSEENFQLNSKLAQKTKLQTLCLPVHEALKKLADENKNFELIISDPPSASSDGDKMTSSYKFYEDDLVNMANLLAPKGLLVLFLNTHTISRKKFEEKIQSLLSKHGLQDNFEIVKRISLELDCPTLKGFIEGDYLKGIFVARKG